MNKNILFLCSLFMVSILLFGQDKTVFPTTEPAFRVDFPSPTADKPQSKLWFDDSCWWAILPRSSGPSLWQRTEDGWKEHTNVRESLRGIPGRADIWADEREITAIGVGADSLAVFRLIKRSNTKREGWEAKKLGRLPLPPGPCTIETGTIAKDSKGEWWIAADIGTKIYVWNSSSDGEIWRSPIGIANGVDEDDICTLTVLPEGVGVIWSNQITETIYIRVHHSGRAIDDWGGAEIIASGNRVADDHLNTAISADGTLWLVTKTSLDELGKPQLVLYMRLPDGRWRNFPYADLGPIRKPSRPIVMASNQSDIILAGHTVYNSQKPGLGEIVFGRADTSNTGVLWNITPVITPDTAGWDYRNRINDPTGPKGPFPGNVSWIILASDREGYVYEADLSKLPFIVNKNK